MTWFQHKCHSYSWFGNSVQELPNEKIAISAHLKPNANRVTVGEVKIFNLTNFELLQTIENPHYESDQFGYAMILSELTINNELKNCLVIGAPTTTYGVHTNAGAIFIYDADSFEFLAKIHSDRSLGIFFPATSIYNRYIF